MAAEDVVIEHVAFPRCDLSGLVVDARDPPRVILADGLVTLDAVALAILKQRDGSVGEIVGAHGDVCVQNHEIDFGAVGALVAEVSRGFEGCVARGVIDTRDVFYFGSIITSCLLVTQAALESRRWR